MVTYHPETLCQYEPVVVMKELFAALDEFPDATVVFTYPNADTGARALIEHLDQWVLANKQRAKVFVSLGQQRYLSLMREADIILGNSSSGLTEAPALKKATINIGERQKGRLKAASVIDVKENKSAIVAAINQVLSVRFRETLLATESLYNSGNVSRRIKDALKIVDLRVQKAFFDIAHGY